MQSFLSSYANAWSRRHRFGGHVFQGRYRTELIEDESYLWTVTRQVHLNPVRAGLAKHPAAWRWSSYPGYARRARRVDWVAYDELLAASTGAFGSSGSDPAASYRRYVSAGVETAPESPWAQAHHGWLLGSARFVERVAALVRGAPAAERRRESRLVRGHSVERVCAIVCAAHGIEREELSQRGSRHPARAAMAYLARQRTSATNAELAQVLGLSRSECVPNLTRRYAKWLATDARVRKEFRSLEAELEDEVRPAHTTKSSKANPLTTRKKT
jgi:hypothetical protein